MERNKGSFSLKDPRHRTHKADPRSPGLTAFGKILYALLQANEMTTYDLAEELGTPRQYVTRIANRVRQPSAKTMSRFLKPFGYKASYEIRIDKLQPEAPVEVENDATGEQEEQEELISD